jgi:hypothetical protein
VIERPVGVFEQRDRDLGAVAGTDDGLMGLFGQATGRVETVDAGAPALVDVEEGLAALEQADIEMVEVVDGVFRGRDDAVGAVAVPGRGVDDEAVVGRLEASDGGLPIPTARSLGLCAEHVEQQPGVDTGGEAGVVFQAGIPAQQ